MKKERSKTKEVYLEVAVFPEEYPYLYAGKSAIVDKTVVGYPYVLKKERPDGKCEYCKFLIVPTFTKTILGKKHGLIGRFIRKHWFLLPQDNFHPVIGELHRFVKMEDDQTMLFENNTRFPERPEM